MSHPEQLGFFAEVARANPDFLDGARILEVGSYDVNGSMRSIFGHASQYVGVDLVAGPGVDLLAFGHELQVPDGSFDAALSGECFEHDPHWRETLATMVRVTTPGGLVAFTCASRGRPEHGTRRTRSKDSPGTQTQGLDHYQNLDEADFAQLPLQDWFSEWQFWHLKTSFDLYFVGIRAGTSPGDAGSARVPPSDRVIQLASLMPVAHRAIRLPLRVVRPMVSEQRYQSLIRPYWQTLIRATDSAGLKRFRRT